MTTHSKGSYVAFRSGRNEPTRRELAARKRLSDELKKFCDEPFPNGAEIVDDENRSVEISPGVFLHRMDLA